MDSALPTDVDQRYSQVKIADTRNIRAAPNTDAKVCGQAVNGDLIYIDPRPSTVVTNNGFKWSRVYLVPSHSRLFKGACPAPEDGVYYIAR